MSPLKLIAGVAMIVVPIVVLLEQLKYAAANGVHGRFMGLAFLRDHLPRWA